MKVCYKRANQKTHNVATIVIILAAPQECFLKGALLYYPQY